MITVKQEIYRQYLTSDAWKKKRLEALERYGCICSRCGEHGTDVHHRTYARIGNETVNDLEVLCRDCHKAHHSAERSSRARERKARVKVLDRRAVFRLLTPSHKRLLMQEFSLSTGDLYIKLTQIQRHAVIERAEQLLGCTTVGGAYFFRPGFFEPEVWELVDNQREPVGNSKKRNKRAARKLRRAAMEAATLSTQS